MGAIKSLDRKTAKALARGHEAPTLNIATDRHAFGALPKFRFGMEWRISGLEKTVERQEKLVKALKVLKNISESKGPVLEDVIRKKKVAKSFQVSAAVPILRQYKGMADAIETLEDMQQLLNHEEKVLLKLKDYNGILHKLIVHNDTKSFRDYMEANRTLDGKTQAIIFRARNAIGFEPGPGVWFGPIPRGKRATKKLYEKTVEAEGHQEKVVSALGKVVNASHGLNDYMLAFRDAEKAKEKGIAAEIAFLKKYGEIFRAVDPIQAAAIVAREQEFLDEMKAFHKTLGERRRSLVRKPAEEYFKPLPD
ncbi:Uncharacterised protein [uncultured archaeon]|nr:Uncharacterised protein [uncultured archaeon]